MYSYQVIFNYIAVLIISTSSVLDAPLTTTGAAGGAAGGPLPAMTTGLPVAVQPTVSSPFCVHTARPAPRAGQAVAQLSQPQRLSTMGDIDTYELDWEKADSLLPIPEYSGPSPRPTFDKPDCTQLSIFSKIFDDEVWQFITDYTNVYAEVFHTAKPEYFTTSGHLYRLESSSATLPWSSPWGLSSCRELLTTGSKNIRVSGCLEYRTLCQETGSRQSPGIFLYFLFYFTVVSIIIMLISRYLHISNRTEEPARGSANYDKLYKVREFHDLLVRKHQPRRQSHDPVQRIHWLSSVYEEKNQRNGA